MRNKPRIRFKGFTEDWEQRELAELCNVYDGTHQTPRYTNSGVMFVSVENIKTLESDKYISEDDFKNEFKIFPEFGDILLTRIGDVGSANIILDNIKRAYYVSLALLKPKGVNSLFLLALLSSASVQSEIWKRTLHIAFPKKINKNEISKVIVSKPSILEQKKIGELIYALDQIITLHQRKLEKLKLAKKALLQKLFPKNGSQFPEIRFKGFTDAWEQREFSDIFAEVKSGLSRMLSNDDIGLPVVRANNINDGQLNLVDDIKYWYKNDPQGANTNNYLIEQGDILINFINSEAKMGTAAYVTRRPERDTIYTTNILRCKVNDEYNPYFIYSLTFLNSYKNYIASITKPAVNQASFTTVDFKKYSIKIPTVKEQNQIADLIETFNKLITLHQRKLDKLQEVKKGLLQKMFV